MKGLIPGLRVFFETYVYTNFCYFLKEVALKDFLKG